MAVSNPTTETPNLFQGGPEALLKRLNGGRLRVKARTEVLDELENTVSYPDQFDAIYGLLTELDSHIREQCYDIAFDLIAEAYPDLDQDSTEFAMLRDVLSDFLGAAVSQGRFYI